MFYPQRGIQHWECCCAHAISTWETKPVCQGQLPQINVTPSPQPEGNRKQGHPNHGSQFIQIGIVQPLVELSSLQLPVLLPPTLCHAMCVCEKPLCQGADPTLPAPAGSAVPRSCLFQYCKAMSMLRRKMAWRAEETKFSGVLRRLSAALQ